MYIKRIITRWSRNDFRAVMACENCGHEQEEKGYADLYFAQNVIPNMKCESCGETSVERCLRKVPG